MRNKTTSQDVSAEYERLLRFLASSPNGTDTTTSKVYRELLLQTGGSITCRGELRDIRAKPLGAGVYLVRTEARR